MKSTKTILSLVAIFVLASLTLHAQNVEYTDARELTLLGQLFPDNANPYQRIDPSIYGGFDKVETGQVRECAGIAVAFQTDSPGIWARMKGLKSTGGGNTGARAKSGLDLYIRDYDGQWRWAGGSPSKEDGASLGLLFYNSFSNEGMAECIVYLPLFSEITSLEIGVVPGKRLEPIPYPFRHRIAVFGSSYTHGFGCSIPSMTWSAQLSRMTGLQFINLGCSGHSKLQSYFAEALADAQVDAFVFDAFSNPTPEEIEARLFPFIETIQAKHPGKPLIFLQTIYREWRYANADVERKEARKMETAAAMMKKACKKYKDVYYVTTTNATNARHSTTVDGTHPGDYGYMLWAESVMDPITEILAQYGIKGRR